MGGGSMKISGNLRNLVCLQILPDIGIMVRVFANVPGYHRRKYRYLMPPCLTFSIRRYRSRVKWSKPGKGEAPSPTPWCKSYRKGSLRVSFDYGRQLYKYYISDQDRKGSKKKKKIKEIVGCKKKVDKKKNIIT